MRIMLATVLLAIMLAFAPPGATVYSAVDAAPHEAAPCSEPVITCRAAWQDLSGDWGPRGRWVRYEQRDEGTVRYWTIARAIADQGELAPWLLTVSFHESGWRLDVHAGRGKWSRGDDQQSWGLYQFLIGRSRRAPVFRTGLTAGEIVGVDDDATDRATNVAASLLAPIVQHCRGEPFCIFGRYGGVGRPTQHKGIRARVRTWNRIRNMLASELELDTHVRELLGLPAPADNTG